jgi:hypothetical protein
MAYSGAHNARVSNDPYPTESAILSQSSRQEHHQSNLFFPDMVFSNAILGSSITKDNEHKGFERVRSHIDRGLFYIPAEELPMISKGEQVLLRYAAGGDAMLLDYCHKLNTEIREQSDQSMTLLTLLLF